MGAGFLRVVVDRPKNPGRTYAGEPVECACGSRQWAKVHRFHYREGRYVQAKAFDLKCAHCGAVRVL